MYHLFNENFSVKFNQNGRMTDLMIRSDPTQMNWIIHEKYLYDHNYTDYDKLFGYFQIKVNGNTYDNLNSTPKISLDKDTLAVNYLFRDFSIILLYSTENQQTLTWSITLKNSSALKLKIDHFMLWFSPSYIMFRDTDVKKNMDHSCAIFTHLSDDYSKIAAVKRNNQGPNLGIYNTQGKTLSVGTYCRYQNRFREQISPSLDGAIFHNFILAGKTAFNDVDKQDWVYKYSYNDKTLLDSEGAYRWEYTFFPFETEQEFLLNGLSLSHPVIEYSPVIVKGGNFEAKIKLPVHQTIEKAYIIRQTADGLEKQNVIDEFNRDSIHQYTLSLKIKEPGKRKLVIENNKNKKDFVVFNVMELIRDLLESRINYLCEKRYISNPAVENAFGFKPISNQGESLGKLSFILTHNLIVEKKLEQINKVEKSAVFYIKDKWFVKGEFSNPRKIHGEFYRIMDFDYIAHVYYLLSRFEANELQYNSPETYLRWASEILTMRFNEDLHEQEREKRESSMNGVFNVYIKDLLEALKSEGLEQQYRTLSDLLKKFFGSLVKQADDYTAAMTEHYFDNAGFGPATESLCISGHLEDAKKYGELILANIGFSNDFRNQNPDRWWEALSYMIHSLWGGLVSHSALVAYEHFQEEDYLHAAYRSMMAVLYCYDWHETSGLTKINKGMAASTYSVSNPNLNNPSLSHNRFGQSVFLEEDKELFEGNATGDDWDMGQELVAYLHGFGTRTYLYIKDGQLKCVNGYIEVHDEEYTVYSFAAYPKKYILKAMNIEVKCQANEVLPKIVLRRNKDGQFECIRKEISKLKK